eukprot:6172629-Pleurochrysis_carterae.AAC.1
MYPLYATSGDSSRRPELGKDVHRVRLVNSSWPFLAIVLTFHCWLQDVERAPHGTLSPVIACKRIEAS